MDVPQTRPRIWSPKIIVFSVVLHAVVLYYIASAFNIVPPIIPTDVEPPTIPIYYNPPEPPTPVETDPVKIKPKFPIRQPKAPPVPTQVEPAPFTPAPAPTTSTGPETINVGTGVPDQPIVKPLPVYPQIALQKEIEGRVRLSITIMPDGSVRDVVVVGSKPRGYFEEAAMRAVRNWRYRPSNMIRKNVIVDIDFVLRG